jgi:hypothetical protein
VGKAFHDTRRQRDSFVGSRNLVAFTSATAG